MVAYLLTRLRVILDKFIVVLYEKLLFLDNYVNSKNSKYNILIYNISNTRGFNIMDLLFLYCAFKILKKIMKITHLSIFTTTLICSQCAFSMPTETKPHHTVDVNTTKEIHPPLTLENNKTITTAPNAPIIVPEETRQSSFRTISGTKGIRNKTCNESELIGENDGIRKTLSTPSTKYQPYLYYVPEHSQTNNWIHHIDGVVSNKQTNSVKKSYVFKPVIDDLVDDKKLKDMLVDFDSLNTQAQPDDIYKRCHCCVDSIGILPSSEKTINQVGYQGLNSLDTHIQDIEHKYSVNINKQKYNYLLEFLKRNNKITNIIDIDCGDACNSLCLHQFLIEEGFSNVRIFPVDKSNCVKSNIPINIIPTHAFKDANPINTVFLCMNTFSGLEIKTPLLADNISKTIKFDLQTLLKNNPKCFVIVLEDSISHLYNNAYPPAEHCYEKHFQYYINNMGTSRENIAYSGATIHHEMFVPQTTNDDFITILNEKLIALFIDRDEYSATILKIKKFFQILRKKNISGLWNASSSLNSILETLNDDELVLWEWDIKQLGLTQCEIVKFLNNMRDKPSEERYFNLYSKKLFKLPFNKIKKKMIDLQNQYHRVECWHIYRG